jgi:hypothetical protein
VFVGMALLFQPFVKDAMSRHVWIIIDVVVAVGLIETLFGQKPEVK